MFSTLLVFAHRLPFCMAFIVAAAIANCIFVYFRANALASFELNHFNAPNANAYSNWQPFPIQI